MERTSFGLKGAIIYQTLDNETVILNLDNGRYYSLNPPASAVWEDLMTSHSPAAIAASFASPANDPAAIEPALAQFVEQLILQDLVVPIATPPDLAPLPSKKNPFAVPTLETFTDMEQLLPLDPIHQVGTRGWPHKETGLPKGRER